MLASLGKFTITGDFAQGHRLLNVFQFVAGEVGFVEGNVGFQVWVVGCRLSVVSCQLSVVGLSVLGCRLSGCRLSVPPRRTGVGCQLSEAWPIFKTVL
jgi:hypothetical protein